MNIWFIVSFLTAAAATGSMHVHNTDAQLIHADKKVNALNNRKFPYQFVGILSTLYKPLTDNIKSVSSNNTIYRLYQSSYWHYCS